MTPKPQPKQFRNKDEAYMKKAYLYTLVLLVIGLLGGLLLADRIVTAEGVGDTIAEEQQQDDGDSTSPPP